VCLINFAVAVFSEDKGYIVTSSFAVSVCLCVIS